MFEFIHNIFPSELSILEIEIINDPIEVYRLQKPKNDVVERTGLFMRVN